MSRIRDLRQEGLTLRGIAAVLGITKAEVVVGLDPEPSPPPEVSRFQLDVATSLIAGATETMTIRGLDWDGSAGEFYDTSLFRLEGEDPFDAITILRAGVYRILGSGRNMETADNPVLKIPWFEFSIDGDFADRVYGWAPESWKTDGSANQNTAGFTPFILPSFQELIKVEADALLEFYMQPATLDDIELNASCRVYLNFQRLGDL